MKLNRREAIALGIAGTGATAVPLRVLAASQPAQVESLRVCGLENPLALGDATPRFSWKLDGAERAGQVAYRVSVARSLEDLATGRNLIWDSGRIDGGSTVDVGYAGPPLPSRSRVWWQVESWTKGSRTPLRSKPAMWETGLAPADWQAEWIASETLVAKADREAGLHWISGPDRQNVGQTRAFRWTFDHPGGAAEFCGTLHELTGVWINGEPAPTPRDGPARHTEMAVWPITLKKGRNVIAIEGRRVGSFGQPPCVAAALLRHGEGMTQRMTSASPGWKTMVAAPEGWHAVAFDDAAWPPAEPAKGALPIGEPWPLTPASRLRHGFSIDKPIRAARLHATALGIYQPWINGAPLADRKLAPEFTDPSKRVLYQTYDVTALLKPGANVLGMVVGDGWYGSRFSTSARFAFGPAPCRMLCQLEIEHDDGSRTVVGSGEGWEIADSAVLEHSLYDGEIHDARAEQSGWASVGGTTAGWRPASVVAAPAIPVEPQRCPPIRVRQTLQPKSVTRLGAGHFVLDYGQNFAGFPRLTVTAPAGTRIEMRFAELLKADGTVDQANLRTAKARDIYIAAGRGREVYEPRFTYHGYRYVEVTGVPDDTGAWSLEGLVAHQDLAETAELRVGDPVIEKFWRNSVWSQRANFYGLPTDCPQRDERLGWMGDAAVFWPAAAWNMDVTAFTARVMEDARVSQSAKGAFPDCIPPFVPTMKLSSPGWADAGVILPHTSWMQNGDTGVIRANWQSMEAYMAWIEAANPDHIWRKQRGADYADWLSVDAPTANPGAATTPKDLLSTAYWAQDATMMAAMAEAIGDAAAAAKYRNLFEAIRSAFNTAFVVDGKVGNGSQTGNVVAIRFGLLSPDATRVAGAALAADIARRGNHLSTGFLGTPHILDALVMAGQEATAISLLTQRSYPSWGYMVEKGATSMWERWNSDQGDVGMNSRNHYAFGAIGDFLFRRIAGIAPATPGFGRVRIAPIMSPVLGSGGATYQSVRGTIRTDWTARDGRFRLDVELPAGVEGEVILPGGRQARAGSGPNRYSGRL
ncbi:alpha-L-rhamnosidase [Novosphingobium jiangmenense]|uniref:alpha-L-rhamnosidase n=1 Tax=Novosphingobium jiangmenense TaxID=2791981 RepID=A0ABS0HBW4_9SPHN|nr:alpha-L-rhamnosidase [Novosphingobium jiangmenense]MBF9149778.1 family 78 glycoside hydrolase catalytic domain [Novosphingobium jiangmenense]